MRHSVHRARGLLRNADGWLLAATIGLLLIGVVMVYSASNADAYIYYGTPYYYVEREALWVLLGGAFLSLTAFVSYHHWQRWAQPFFGVALLLLVLVMIPGVGHASHGAQRWISIIPGLPIQPSELVKLGLIVYLAKWLPTKGEGIRDLKKGFMPFSFMVGILALLIIKQPDLGTAIVLTATAVAVYFLAGAALPHLGIVAGGAVGFGILLSRSAGYRQGRLTAFLDPWQDPTGVGYHTLHALIALRTGGLTGVGLGNSEQKWALPAPHTDSILAVTGEELGLIGLVVILCLFLVIAYRGIKISNGAPDPFGRLLAAGITCWISFQALLNFAVITSSVPFTGVPLPFVSYGGTSLIITLAAVGILLNISRHSTGEGFARYNPDNGRGKRRTRLPRVVHHPASARRLRAAPQREPRTGVI